MDKITSEIENKIIDLVVSRRKAYQINKKINVYPWVREMIKKIFGIDIETEQIREICRKYRKKNSLDENFNKKNTLENTLETNTCEEDLGTKQSYKEYFEIRKDGTQVSDKLLKMSAEEAKDVKFLLKAHGFDTDAWELVSARNNIWNVYSKIHGVQVLYSSKIVVKPLVMGISFEDIKNHFVEASKMIERPQVEPIKVSNSGKMLEVDLADVHFAKLCHYSETGNNYDYKIASQRFLDMINDICSRVKDFKFEKILFIFGNDFFNSTTIENTTIHGTAQDNDLRWSKMFLKGCEVLVQGIDLLSQIAPIEIIYIAGNHDYTVSFYALNYISAWYRNNSNIKVEVSPITRKYVQFGQVLLGWSHGDTEKKRINTLMQIEVPELWGKCKWREFHLHHLHHEKTIEGDGLIIRYLPSIVATDLWHYQSGYVGNIAKTQSFIWDKEKGLECILNSVII